MNGYIFVPIIVILLYLYYLASKTNNSNVVENLDDIQGRYCEKCDGLSFGQCMRCFNCGFKAEGYKGKCMKGEMIAPKNLKSTERWLTNDTFWRNIYANPSNNCASTSFTQESYTPFPLFNQEPENK